MNEEIRDRLLEVYEAFYSGRIDEALSHYADDVNYVCYAPVSLFPQLGFRHGKDQLAETMRALHRRFQQMKYTVPRLLTGENEAAAILDVRMQITGTERLMQIYISNFVRFKHGQIVDHRTFLDSFDVLEQLSGEEIDFAKLCPAV
jgi:hypothetical protein